LKFRVAESKHEVFGEASGVALYGLIQGFGGHLVDLRQVAREHHFLAANHIDAALDQWHGSRDLACK
jgi:hypothetical protein